MGKLIDLTGKRFGRLQVIKKAGYDKTYSATWLCVCDCGKEKIVSGRHLRNGRIKSCGCYIKEKFPVINFGKFREDMKPSKEPTPVDIAWAAGIFEGEGTASAVKENSTQVIVVQKDDWILIKLRDLFGGSVKQTKKGTKKWTVYGEFARRFLNYIVGYLSPHKQEQVMKALHLNKILQTCSG